MACAPSECAQVSLLSLARLVFGADAAVGGNVSFEIGLQKCSKHARFCSRGSVSNTLLSNKDINDGRKCQRHLAWRVWLAFTLKSPASRYKAWRSNRDKYLHLKCAESKATFEALPASIRQLGTPTSKFEPEAVSGIAVRDAKCPECKGTGQVDMHGGLRKRSCPRCGGKSRVRRPARTP
jgi:hypothetical protein